MPRQVGENSPFASLQHDSLLESPRGVCSIKTEFCCGHNFRARRGRVIKSRGAKRSSIRTQKGAARTESVKRGSQTGEINLSSGNGSRRRSAVILWGCCVFLGFGVGINCCWWSDLSGCRGRKWVWHSFCVEFNATGVLSAVRVCRVEGFSVAVALFALLRVFCAPHHEPTRHFNLPSNKFRGEKRDFSR